MIIFLGSTRAAKVDGAREAFAAIATVDERFASAEVRLLDMGAAGPAMPMTEAAIVEGARIRAAALVTTRGRWARFSRSDSRADSTRFAPPARRTGCSARGRA